MALAAEEPLVTDLAAHVPTCADCSRARSASKRFDVRLDAAAAQLITDALPASTPIVARTTPPYRPRPAPRVVASLFVGLALTAFATVGVMTTATSLSRALGGSPAAAPPTTPAPGTVDCYLGEPAVDVAGARDFGSAPGVAIAYCFDTDDRTADPGQPVVTCVRSANKPSVADQSEEEAREYLAACTTVEEARRAASSRAASSPDDEIPALPAAPFKSWDAASASVSWSIRRPAWTPDGYELAALQGFGTSTRPGGIETVVATYLRNGTPLSLEQFVLAPSDEFRIELDVPHDDLPDVTTGRTTVGNHAAFWVSGVASRAFGGSGVPVDTVTLTWRTGDVGYRITAWNVSLDELRRMAASLDDQ